MERKIFRPGAEPPAAPRFEWVEFENGCWVCVRGMTAADAIRITERSERPKIDPQGGHSKGRMVQLQIVASCYDGEGPEAKPIFTEADFVAINALSFQDFDRLLGAINRVNGKDATETELLRDFTTATEAQKPSE